jgi:hypothetical protein
VFFVSCFEAPSGLSYALWYSVHVSLYIPDCVNLFGGGLCGVSSLPMVLFVRKAI